MKRNLSCPFALLCLCLLTACSTSDELQVDEKPNETSRQEMKINLFLQEGDQLIPMNDRKSSTSRASENTLSNGFMLYGLYTSKDMPTATNGSLAESSSRRFFDKTSIDASGKYSDGTRYWVSDGATRHSFFAYSGVEYNTTLGYGIEAINGLNSSSISYPSLTYSQANAPAFQQDYLVAYGPTNLLVNQAAPEVNIRFRHACSRVIFKIMASGGVSYYKAQVKITYGANRSRQGDVYFEPKAKSNNNSYFSGTYLLKDNFTVPSSANTEGKAIEAGELLLPPQNMDASGWVQVLVNYTLSENSDIVPANVKKSNVPAIVLEPDRQYTYYFKLAESSDNLTLYDVVVEPWTTKNVIVDELN